MNKSELLTRYITLCNDKLKENTRVRTALKKQGIYETFMFENFSLGYDDGSLLELIGDNAELAAFFTDLGLIKNNRALFANHLTIPVHDENKAIVNIAFVNPGARKKKPPQFLNNDGVFNKAFLKNSTELILTDHPLETLFLIQNNVPNTTFIIDADTIFTFCQENTIRKAVFTMDGRATLYYKLTSNGISTRRTVLDFDTLPPGECMTALMDDAQSDDSPTDDIIREIEKGFLFQFPHLSYRVVGNFSEPSMNLKANIKVFTKTEVFVDTLDLYKNRDRQNFVYNIMDKFNIRDQVLLENDLNRLIDVIEKHREKKENEKKQVKPELTDYQKDIGTTFLQNPNLIDELAADITDLGYVREKKNKVLMYLIMTSRLLTNPLHAIIISRSGAGKSQLVDIIETLCPPEELVSVSDLSAQALYYYGQDDLKNRFIVVGEKEGSKGSDYPLRELISKKSITKAVPMKDPITGQIKTAAIKVNGPIALVETTTNGEINPENLNRCFVIGIDESEEQTRLIHHNQRTKYTLEGHLYKKNLGKIREKHIYAQRLLRPIHVFNPYAPLLTFPSSRLQTRRDNEKLLKLICVICFLHQYQRKEKKEKLENNEILEYIECTVDDYRIAHDLLKDGILDDTLDDLPRPARELFDLIKQYLKTKSEKDEIPVEKIIFTRKEIREYTSWSFAQVRNNIRTLKDYEYLQLVKSQKGTASQYKLNGCYSDIDFLTTILTPEELKKRIKAGKNEPKPGAKTKTASNK